MSGISIQTRAVGGADVAASLEASAVEVQSLVNRATVQAGERLLESIQEHASHRPGPNIVTGEYVSSWVLTVTYDEAGNAYAEVYTDAEFAMRLEHGFAGLDSQGRQYNQPPYPHVEPAMVEMEAKFPATVETAVRIAP